MGKKTDKRIKAITKALRDPDLKKKARKALEAELAELHESPATEGAIPPSKASEDKPVEHVDPKAEAKAKGIDFNKLAYDNATKAERKSYHHEANPGETFSAWLARAIAAEVPDEPKAEDWNPHLTSTEAEVAKSVASIAKDAPMPGVNESDEEIKARVKAKREARAAEATSFDEGNVTVEDGTVIVDLTETKSKKKGSIAAIPEVVMAEAVERLAEVTEVATTVESGALADPEAVQPRDRWDRPMIEPVGGGKAKGYRRTTTYIDVIDDKTNLIDWGRRVVLAGVGADEESRTTDEGGSPDSIVGRVVIANGELDKAAKAANKALAKGKINADQHAEAHDVAERAHKAALSELVTEAFTAGDGFVKAETGTRIHKLTEVFDTVGPTGLADMDVTESEWRDLNAYAAACAALNVEIIDVEQFVVVDDLQVGGTLDRRLRYDSPKLGRRITAIGDVKTGRVDYGAGKMTRQLAIYAKGKGYDWREPSERKVFRTNQEVGLIFHIPAGKGICEVYEIDLKKGWEGVQLCAKVWAHRSETSTAKVFDKVASVTA